MQSKRGLCPAYFRFQLKRNVDHLHKSMSWEELMVGEQDTCQNLRTRIMEYKKRIVEETTIAYKTKEFLIHH